MTVNPDVVRRRCTEIEESVARLEGLAAIPVDEFLASQDHLDVASYRLLVAIEAALALCYHVSARLLKRAPEDYAACFETLRNADLIPVDLAERLRRMARFRNLLVHMYWRIEYRLVHEMLNRDLGDLRAFASAMTRLVPFVPDAEDKPS
jgi:uncharacterized protein YutE (UPF0331/DUF86 family)